MFPERSVCRHVNKYVCISFGRPVLFDVTPRVAVNRIGKPPPPPIIRYQRAMRTCMDDALLLIELLIVREPHRSPAC